MLNERNQLILRPVRDEFTFKAPCPVGNRRQSHSQNSTNEKKQSANMPVKRTRAQSVFIDKLSHDAPNQVENVKSVSNTTYEKKQFPIVAIKRTRAQSIFTDKPSNNLPNRVDNEKPVPNSTNEKKQPAKMAVKRSRAQSVFIDKPSNNIPDRVDNQNNYNASEKTNSLEEGSWKSNSMEILKTYSKIQDTTNQQFNRSLPIELYTSNKNENNDADCVDVATKRPKIVSDDLNDKDKIYILESSKNAHINHGSARKTFPSKSRMDQLLNPNKEIDCSSVSSSGMQFNANSGTETKWSMNDDIKKIITSETTTLFDSIIFKSTEAMHSSIYSHFKNALNDILNTAHSRFENRLEKEREKMNVEIEQLKNDKYRLEQQIQQNNANFDKRLDAVKYKKFCGRCQQEIPTNLNPQFCGYECQKSYW